MCAPYERVSRSIDALADVDIMAHRLVNSLSKCTYGVQCEVFGYKKACTRSMIYRQFFSFQTRSATKQNKRDITKFPQVRGLDS